MTADHSSDSSELSNVLADEAYAVAAVNFARLISQTPLSCCAGRAPASFAAMSGLYLFSVKNSDSDYTNARLDAVFTQ